MLFVGRVVLHLKGNFGSPPHKDSVNVQIRFVAINAPGAKGILPETFQPLDESASQIHRHEKHFAFSRLFVLLCMPQRPPRRILGLPEGFHRLLYVQVFSRVVRLRSFPSLYIEGSRRQLIQRITLLFRCHDRRFFLFVSGFFLGLLLLATLLLLLLLPLLRVVFLALVLVALLLLAFVVVSGSCFPSGRCLLHGTEVHPTDNFSEGRLASYGGEPAGQIGELAAPRSVEHDALGVQHGGCQRHVSQGQMSSDQPGVQQEVALQRLEHLTQHCFGFCQGRCVRLQVAKHLLGPRTQRSFQCGLAPFQPLVNSRFFYQVFSLKIQICSLGVFRN